jgi:hypothetical protein
MSNEMMNNPVIELSEEELDVVAGGKHSSIKVKQNQKVKIGGGYGYDSNIKVKQNQSVKIGGGYDYDSNIKVSQNQSVSIF